MWCYYFGNQSETGAFLYLVARLRQVLLHDAFLFEDLCKFSFVSDDFTIQILKNRLSEFIFLLCVVYTGFPNFEAARKRIPELIVGMLPLEMFAIVRNNVSITVNTKLLFQTRPKMELLEGLGLRSPKIR